ncbi:hypothetical protein CDAR_230402 [Caerostris darwini]|uniref:AAA+ ATPase domain-containing protein n=1 Tax=Caerostris darwini TaxID=1538125 RepID=A0AAV4W9T0_9ARAC|nr:hypothetical protein CDAR_230402 [Caerostris darwini]
MPYLELSLGIPTLNQRKEILKSVTKFHHSDEIDYEKIASLIPGFVVNDMAQLTHEAIKVNKKAKNGGGDAYNNFSLTTEDFEEALHSVSPSILKRSKWHLKVKPVYWKDIGGMQKIKERLQWGIELPLRQPEIFKNVDLDCPRGVLLFGPPGCCKTTLARGLATECNANFFAANPSQIYSSYVGDSEKNIAELFYQARLSSPSIIFLDELDSLVGCRDFATKQQGVAEKVLSTLLNEMDGLGIKTQYGEDINSEILKKDCPGGERDTVRKNDVIVIAATNRPDCIDAALLRPGRFDIIVYIPPPNSEERESILQILTNGMPLQGVDFKT